MYFRCLFVVNQLLCHLSYYYGTVYICVSMNSLFVQSSLSIDLSKSLVKALGISTCIHAISTQHSLVEGCGMWMGEFPLRVGLCLRSPFVSVRTCIYYTTIRAVYTYFILNKNKLEDL